MTTIHEVRAVEQTMPARASTLGEVLRDEANPVTLGDVVRAAEPYAGHEKVLAAMQEQAADTAGGDADLERQLIASNQRAAALAEQLAATTARLDAVEHRAADLEDRNRELAADLDTALDQLQGHALDADQEQLVPTPRYLHAFANVPGHAFAGTEREGVDR